MKRVPTLLDEGHASQLGPGAEPQLDHIIAPITAEAGEALNQAYAAALTECNEAARVQRTGVLARRQVNDLDRPIECGAGSDGENEAVGKKRSVERCEGSGSIERCCFEPCTHEIRPLDDCHRHRPEPDARGQLL